MPTSHRKHGTSHSTSDQPADRAPAGVGMWHSLSAPIGLAPLPAAVTAIGQEWSDFVLRRLKEDAALPGRLAASRSPEEFWDCYAGFWMKLAADYRQQWDVVARLGSEHMQAWPGAQQPAFAPDRDDVASQHPRH